MSCTLAVIASCFSLSGFYADVSAMALDGIDRSATFAERTSIRTPFLRETQYTEHTTYSRHADNPYVRVALGYEVEFTVFGRACRGYGEVWHLSSIATGRDRGFNALGALGARCSLFGRSR